jgi:hypothetical protein
MLPTTMYRQKAREYLDRAERARVRDRKLRYLRLAVSNSVRAQALESEHEEEGSAEEMQNSPRSRQPR